MNKIKVIDNKVVDYDKNTNIIINDYSKGSTLNISKENIFIYIPSNINVNIILECEYNDAKQDIVIFVDKYSFAKVFVYKKGNNMNGNIKYILLDNSKIIVNKYCDIANLDENVNILLNGIDSKIEYNFSTISNSKKTYNININHNNVKTNSSITCHGISQNNATLKFDISGYIDRGNSKSVLNQNNKIIVLGQNQSTINPKLYIYENDVDAKHAAVIGRFNDNDLFYLKSRGIDEKSAIKLLAKGFLLGIIDIPESKNFEILESINTYWE